MKKDLEKYIIFQKEVAVYEILAYSKEDAIEAYEAGDGDFVGFADDLYNYHGIDTNVLHEAIDEYESLVDEEEDD